jgi:hypothetical protein
VSSNKEKTRLTKKTGIKEKPVKSGAGTSAPEDSRHSSERAASDLT